ncbi:MAG: HIT family protein [Thermoplasmata archaeon]
MPQKQLKLFEDDKSQYCEFCEIISGRKEAAIVYSDQYVVVFLDKKPVFKGHCLVATRKHFENIYELDKITVDRLFVAVQVISKAVQDATDSDGTFIAVNNVVSQSVPHVHVHIVPRRYNDGLKGFFWPRTKYDSAEEAEEYAAKIRSLIAVNYR